MINYRIGNGFDVHALVHGRALIIGGVKIDYPLGLDGHSDADVLIHSIIDSFLSPANIGDIGQLFPDTDPAYKNISSLNLLKEVCSKLTVNGFSIINTDSVVICDKPKISPYINDMKKNISDATGGILLPNSIGIKGKTTEKLGFTGRGEGIAVYTVSLLYFDPALCVN
ncbi:MAG TPA: 2-C-methyl-D-erythritol 2,4-cyclodiphosphate synthase [Spirochaetota bacterium]|nr:2-C-methyl-D-erythritol 2,4-cyclodiphosphate synthase [Spirochaetota bacterium]HPS85386.1 2-C-methyl-D-erythritol 2,4-cyclodiphosphate synthase [Spirochaetota bacterium]